MCLDWFILKNTERAVSGLIHTEEYRESSIWIDIYLEYRGSCNWIDTYGRIQRENYLDWYILKNAERVVTGWIHTEEYRERCIWIDTYWRIQREVYLDWYILINTEEVYLDWYRLKYYWSNAFCTIITSIFPEKIRGVYNVYLPEKYLPPPSTLFRKVVFHQNLKNYL